MARYKKKQRKEHVVTEKVSCTALVLLDTKKVRRKAITALKRNRTSYTKAEKQWEFFEKQEMPAFRQWMAGNFGAMLSEGRELQQKIDYSQTLYHAVMYECSQSGDPPDVCYARVLDMMEHPEKYRKEESRFDPFGDMDDEESFGDRDAYGEGEETWAEFEAMMDDMLGIDSGDGKEAKGACQERRYRVRQIYRDLARRIHPDTSGEMTQEVKTLWHAVQEAYEREDLEALEVLQANLNMLGGAIPDSTSVSHIMELARSFREALRALRSTIRRAKKDPAWGFLSVSDMHKKEAYRQIERQLEREFDDLHEQLACAEARLEVFKKIGGHEYSSASPHTLADLFEELMDESCFY
ncbi:MAG: J domain-containing protein [Spartobacteria bacterium]|nr:J domain-containing protein [Spartobacteria bacterium]